MADDTPSNDNSKPDIYKLADDDGRFKRKDSQFRDWVSTEPDAKFWPRKEDTLLYLNRGCPWAHRANIVHKLKGLEDVIQIVTMGYNLTPDGWIYDGPTSDPCDPIYGFTKHKQLYYKADPDYTGRFTVPVLWDRKHETIVNNESSDIIRMFYTAFDAFIPPHLRETAKPLFPLDKQPQITSMNDWIYPPSTNGVYKCGFATTQSRLRRIHPPALRLTRPSRIPPRHHPNPLPLRPPHHGRRHQTLPHHRPLRRRLPHPVQV
ncbi:hypothetical protein DID88_007246 [Monilinia fructigena]|uniref:GST N-terminal domain-containing protein n=1 Tax=Monilinia fructigena TaxID=38457 RepID=A0A395J8Q8_9HELO|nr:hypothetical protein DID88_007246 [Monilinia fructigena]